MGDDASDHDKDPAGAGGGGSGTDSDTSHSDEDDTKSFFEVVRAPCAGEVLAIVTILTPTGILDHSPS